MKYLNKSKSGKSIGESNVYQMKNFKLIRFLFKIIDNLWVINDFCQTFDFKPV